MHGDSIRARGSGSLIRRRDHSGVDSWYGKWRIEGRQVMRVLGRVQTPENGSGLTPHEAEVALRIAMEQTRSTPPPATRLDLAEAGRRYLANRETVGLKHSTLLDYESYLRVHLVPFFNARPLDEIEPDMVEEFIAAKRRDGKAIKSIVNYLSLLQAIFGHAVRREWCQTNPVLVVDKPRQQQRDPDIRFLTGDELESLLRGTPRDRLGRLERTLYLTAAMTGMRRGELLALRWQDVDWENGLIRVRRNYTKGQFGAPKSRRSSRAVPLAESLSTELRGHRDATDFTRDTDLVFGHPVTGTVLDPSKLRKRFLAAARRAGIRPVRFHDLRHTFGTRMASAGAPLRAVQEWMGHADQRTTLIYADYAPDVSQGAMWASRAFDKPTPSNLFDMESNKDLR
jgi:integrase